tara:strand:- start:40 stop:264 length:225 start_codon:yes stop_codon:yes gene_type:complete
MRSYNNMGHYDDIIDAREAREDQEKADRLGVTVDKMYADERYRREVNIGRELFIKQRKEQAFIAQYLQDLESRD